MREICLQGRLAGEAIDELARVSQGLEPPIRIDLSQLLSADEAGLAALRVRQQAGEELVGARPLIRHLLIRPEERQDMGFDEVDRWAAPRGTGLQNRGREAEE